MKLLEAISLTKIYGREGKWLSSKAKSVYAVNNLSLTINEGENVALIGESGCGKSTLARLLLGLERPTSGRVIYRGTDFTDWRLNEMRTIRRKMQMVFQNSLASFNPLFTVEQIIGEPLKNYGMKSKIQRRETSVEMLAAVGLEPWYLHRYPHELSGGQQQRVGIARALALRPELIICDEPFSSLDVTLRKQMIQLLNALKQELGLSYIFITHDLSLVHHFCDSVAVMTQGQIVEQQHGDRLLEQASHPYTRTLLASLPIWDPRMRNTYRNEQEDSLLSNLN